MHPLRAQMVMSRYRPKPCADCPGRQSLMCCRSTTREPLPVGTYSMTIERVRKVRNKPYYRIHYRMSDGTRTTGIMRP